MSISVLQINRYFKLPDTSIVCVRQSWSWMPDDFRAQPLYAAGYLPPDAAAQFESDTENAEVWLVGNTVFYEYSQDSVPASVEQKRSILDGWVLMQQYSEEACSVIPVMTPHQDDTAFWSFHKHAVAPGVIELTPTTGAAALKQQQDAARALLLSAPQSSLREAQSAWDAKRDVFTLVAPSITATQLEVLIGSRPVGVQTQNVSVVSVVRSSALSVKLKIANTTKTAATVEVTRINKTPVSSIVFTAGTTTQNVPHAVGLFTVKHGGVILYEKTI